MNFVLGTTLPYIEPAMAAIGSSTAVYTLARPEPRRAAAVGTAFAVLYILSLAVVSIARGGSLHLDPPGIALLLALGLGGAAFTVVAGSRPADALHITPALAWMTRTLGRFIAAPLVAWIAIVSVLLGYGLGVVAAVVVLTVAAIVVAVWLALFFMRAGKDEAPSIFIPKGGRIREDGRIVRERVWGSDEETGQRILEDGRVVKEGIFSDDATGLRIDHEGHVIREGILGDTATGVRLKRGYDGTRQVVKEGIFSDTATGLELTTDGRVEETGLLWNDRTGVEIRSDGEVHQVHGELARNGRLIASSQGGAELVDEGLLFDDPSGVRIDADGKGYRAGVLYGENDADLSIDEALRVKQRR